MKKLLKVVLSFFMVMALVIQLQVNLVSVANAEESEITSTTYDDENDIDEDDIDVQAVNDTDAFSDDEDEIATIDSEDTAVEDTVSVDLDASRTTIYLNNENAGYGYLTLTTNLNEEYTVAYTLSQDGIVELEEIDDATHFNAIAVGTVTITATVTTDSGNVGIDTIDITVNDYLDEISDYSMEDPEHSGFYFVYSVLSEEDKTIEIIDYYFNTEYYSSPFVINIPSTINGYTVVSLGDYAFYGCGDTMKVSIPANVTNIGDAFSKYFPIRTLYVYSGSAALKYAIANDFNYAIIDETVDSVSYDGDYVYNLMYNTVISSSYNYIDYDYGITTVSNRDINTIKSNLASNQEILKTFGFKLTVDWYGYVGDDYVNDMANINSLSSEITFNIAMDTSKYANGTLTILLLNEDGTVTKITPTITASGITFSTSKIGSFALVYTDSTKAVANTTSSNTNTSSSVSNPQTGDETQVIGYSLLCGIAVIGAYYSKKKKYN